jgi:transposase-like protein
VPETADTLHALPETAHGEAKQDLHAIHGAEDREAAEDAFDRCSLAGYGAKHGKAAACSSEDRPALPAFHDSPAEHGAHVRTSNPVESTFATARLRTDRTKGGGRSRRAALAPRLAPRPAAPRDG